MSTTTAATTTTEISSNSNSSCRLLDCLNTLPFQDQRAFRNLFSYKELVRLSACCRSLTSSVRNDRALWQALYHRDFLSGVYYAKEMEFVLWCIRTDINNPCTSDKRADLLENVDWYNTYRRRVSTENNWRYGRYNTTRININSSKRNTYLQKDAGNRIFITQRNRKDKVSRSYRRYILDYLPHSNLRSSNNNVYKSPFLASPNVTLLDNDVGTYYFYVMGDHYIAASRMPSENMPNHDVKILSRKHGGVFTTFDVPAQYEVTAVEGKWALLMYRSKLKCDGSPRYILGIMAFDIDNSIMCPGNIDGTWDTARFYKTTDTTATLYTARIVKDDVRRIEWALYEFSSNNPVVQLQNGWFQLPKCTKEGLIYFAHNPYDSHMIIELYRNRYYDPYIIHSVASNGQSHTPRNCYTITDQHMPIPLLRTGCGYSIFDCKPPKVWTDLSYNDDQVLQIPGTTFIRNLIGDLYVVDVKDHNRIKSQLLVDINTKEVIREFETPSRDSDVPDYTMVGKICSRYNSHEPIIHEYGEL